MVKDSLRTVLNIKIMFKMCKINLHTNLFWIKYNYVNHINMKISNSCLGNLIRVSVS